MQYKIMRISMTNISRLGSWYPSFGKSDFFFFFFFFFSSWPVDQLHVALVRGLINPPDRYIYAPDCLWTMIDRTGPSEHVYLFCCVTPQLLLSLRLGLWPSEPGTSEIVAKLGGNKFWRLSQMRELKSEVQNPTLFYNVGYPPKPEIS